MFWCKHANTRKHVSEQSCSSLRAFLSILAHLAHLACSFSLIFNRMNELMFWFKHANTKKHLSKHSWLCSWVILNILTHLAHLAQSYFSLLFRPINIYNSYGIILTNKKIWSDWKQKLDGNWCLRLFSLRR